MKYICVTEIDADTKIVCTAEPMRTGPSFPFVKGLEVLWNNVSAWPVSCVNGVYQTPPRYYGTCDDDADTTVSGVVEVLNELDYTRAKQTELEARRPYPSWISDIETMSWISPVPYPNLTGTEYFRRYEWDEVQQVWVDPQTNVETL